MSAAAAPKNVSQSQERIRSPLDRLRKFIRTYVTLEGAALALLFLAAWFWIGLAIDYGMFKLFGSDLVQYDPHKIFRIVVLIGLGGCLLALLAVTIVARLIVQFSDIAVALVLEKRFPDLLGDRLITAVELHDPQEAAKHGYSPDMVRQTIHEAAAQVEKVPVKDAFDWGRLVRRGVWIVAGTLGLAFLSAGGFAVARAVTNEGSPVEGAADLADVSSMWVERNILLQNTIWPRRSHLEIVNHPPELRIPRKSRPEKIVVRAWKYVVADGTRAEGWRQMLWTAGDLAKAGLDGAPKLPKEWKPRPGLDSLTVDEVDIKLDAFPLRTSLAETELPAKWNMPTIVDDKDTWRPMLWSDLTRDRLDGLDVQKIAAIAPGMTVDDAEELLTAAKPDDPRLADARTAMERLRRLADLRQTLDNLDFQLAARSLRRTARKLIIPGKIHLLAWNRSASLNSDLAPESGNLFTGGFPELEESTSYRVSGEDYVTPTQRITVVDRPLLESLTSEEERPAYLYYRPAPAGSPTALELAGKRQRFAPYMLGVSGETTTLDVPLGTSVTLEAMATKPLEEVTLEVDAKNKKALVAYTLEKTGERTFRCLLPDIRRTQTFAFRFRDIDNVVAERKMVINPRSDLAPVVREFNPDDAIRKEKGMFLVTAKARIPFKARVRDDHGLANLRYGCKVNLASDKGTSAIDLLAALPLFGAVPALARSQAAATAEQVVELPGFGRAVQNHPQPNDPQLNEGKREFLNAELSLGRLGKPQIDPFRKLFSEYVVGPDDWTRNDPSRDPWKKRANGKEYADTENSWLRAKHPDAPLENDLALWLLKWTDGEGKRQDLEERDEGKQQKRFAIEVRLLADDTYLDGGIAPATGKPQPHVTPSSETFLFMVVSENELLAEIGKDEELKYRDMLRSYKPLPENLARVREMSTLLPTDVSAVELNNMQARCESLAEALKISQADAKLVKDTYEKLIREMRLNQIKADMMEKVLSIHKPLGEVDAIFGRTNSSVTELRTSLASATATKAQRVEAVELAKKNLTELVTKMDSILKLMEGLNTLNKLIDELVKIEREEETQEDLAKRIIRRLTRELFEGK